jgi:hypothetical protein
LGIVDVNPRKRGSFVPGTGHRVLAPPDLLDEKVRTVFVVNPIYRDEIHRQLSDLGIAAEVETVT